MLRLEQVASCLKRDGDEEAGKKRRGVRRLATRFLGCDTGGRQKKKNKKIKN